MMLVDGGKKFTGIVRDISSRKQAEKNWELSEPVIKPSAPGRQRPIFSPP
ncbi:MAG: hypothetical protein L6Q34_05345 [Nitrospira sp.]|nr:MAG: hypothetical protein UZ03_NOB001002579 [Nitrospira sp. OLB3]MCK6492837.1 hypothetical protein [Nitrospira sp.]MCK6499639.1 hypothetical protein [Nitrospira sp.]MEB2337891.1 hypothetical protein [Nitrospirales bacterium]QOJ34977.1 MAG: hypothetical protein HRU82_08470 [Nitrospira sp.]